MMKQVRRTSKAQRAKPSTLPAPIGGLNGRDGLADMPPIDAFVLDNWIPKSTTVDTRNGSMAYATGIAGPVESLETYEGGASPRMLAFGDGKVFNVTVGGAVGAPLAAGRVSNQITTAMFSNAGNQFLLGLSGADAPFSYDGTTFAALTITGVTGGQTTLLHICAFKGRVYLGQKDQLGFYYLAVGAIQGAASYFDLSQVSREGGALAGIATFSADSGNGPADYIVFMTTKGEYLVYAGTDPSNSATWALVSRYYSSPPIGRKGYFNFRADLYIISQEGVVSFSQIRSSGETAIERDFLSAKLGRYLTDVAQYDFVHGWCAVTYPRGNMLVINTPATPTANGAYNQFVMNTNSNEPKWTRFTGWNGLCWTTFKDRMYFGTYNGRVMLADEGGRDDGQPIKYDARQAYNYFDDGNGMGNADKHFHFATFIMQADGTPGLSAELNVNFEDDQPQYAGNLTGQEGGTWDVSFWDAADWGGEGATQNFTVSFGKIGYAASIWVRALLDNNLIKWYATRLVYERAKGIVLL